jgi:hypothetical protein
MKRTALKTGMVLLVASLIFAGEAFAGWGGGYRRGGRGPGRGLERGTPAEPQEQAPWMGRGAGPAWERGTPGEPQEQAPWMGYGRGRGAPIRHFGRGGPGRGYGPWYNVPLAYGPHGGNYGVCPYCGAPCRGGWGAGFGYGRGPMFRFENRDGRPGPGFRGRAWRPWGQGFGRGNWMRQAGPPAENWRRGPWQGRGGEGFPPQGQIYRRGGERPRWWRGEPRGRSDPNELTPSAPGSGSNENDNDFWAPPRWQRWGRGRGWALPPADEPNDNASAGPEAAAPMGKPADEPLQTPEANAPEPQSPQQQ